MKTHQRMGIRPVALWITGGLSAGVLTIYVALLARQRQVDFQVYRMGGQHVLGSGLYSAHIVVDGRGLPFSYTPLAALIFWPFSHLSIASSQFIWDLTNVVALTALIAVSLAAARNRSLVRSDWRTALLLVAPIGILLWPVRLDLELGQINIMLVLMIVTDLTVGISWRDRRLPRGVLVGVAAAIKLTPLVFIPFLLVTRQWRAARNATLAFLVATLGMVALVPGPSWLYFTKYAFEVRRLGNTYDTTNQTLQSALDRAGLAPTHAVVDLLLLVVLVAGLALAALAYRRSSALLGVLVCAAVGLMISPVSWQHHYVWCVPLLVWLAAGVDRPKRGVMWAGIGAIVFMVTPPGVSDGPNVPFYVRENAYVIAISGFGVLVAALLWARRREKASSSNLRHILAGQERLAATQRDRVIQARWGVSRYAGIPAVTTPEEAGGGLAGTGGRRDAL